MSRGCRIYIGNLPPDCREKDLDRFFKGYGRKTDVLIKQGFGFVEFEDYRDADDAVYELNGKDLLGERVSVEHARGTRRASSRDRGRYGPPTRTDYRVLVENLSTRVSWQVLSWLAFTTGQPMYHFFSNRRLIKTFDMEISGVINFICRIWWRALVLYSINRCVMKLYSSPNCILHLIY